MRRIVLDQLNSQWHQIDKRVAKRALEEGHIVLACNAKDKDPFAFIANSALILPEYRSTFDAVATSCKNKKSDTVCYFVLRDVYQELMHEWCNRH